MILRTNVKLNLGLNVLRKRPDGYHDIETLFVPCYEFGDKLEVIKGDDYSRTSAALFARYRGALQPEGQPTLGDTQPQRSEDGLCRGRTAPPPSCEAEAGQMVQAISPDGKLMITIARAEGVDWDPLEDLCAKAYRLLDQEYNLPPVKIFLEKTAPVGAGLGGGSADAAFTLKALNELCGLGLTQEKLSEYASCLGSDCTFFVWNRPMIGTGRGEVLEPFDLPGGNRTEEEGSRTEEKANQEDGVKGQGLFERMGLTLKVLVPEGVSVSTAEAYKGIVPRDQKSAEEEFGHKNETFVPDNEKKELLGTEQVFPCPKTKGKDGQELKEALCRPIAEWKDVVINDFEATVFKAHPELAAIKQSLYDSGAVYASMSGSGSALFALYRS